MTKRREFPEYRSHKRPEIERVKDAVTDQQTTIKWLEKRNEKKNQRIRQQEREITELEQKINALRADHGHPLGDGMKRFGANFEDSTSVEVTPGQVVDADSEIRNGVGIRTCGVLRIVLDEDGALDLATKLADALEESR